MIGQVNKVAGGGGKGYRPIRFKLFNRPSAVASVSSVLSGLTVIGSVLVQVVELLATLGHIPTLL